jgi:hypothetical protein
MLVPALLTANPVGSLVDHAGMHIAAWRTSTRRTFAFRLSPTLLIHTRRWRECRLHWAREAL